MRAFATWIFRAATGRGRTRLQFGAVLAEELEGSPRVSLSLRAFLLAAESGGAETPRANPRASSAISI